MPKPNVFVPFIKNIGLLIISLTISIVLIFFAGEFFFRHYTGIKEHKTFSIAIAAHKTRGWACKPGKYSYFDMRAFRKTNMSINSLGIRGKNISLKVAYNKKRITIIGDSMAFSAIMSDAHRFSGILQSTLGEECEIVNVSVPGYGTGQEILFLNELLSKGYETGNKVILAFFTNDISDNVGINWNLERIPRTPAFDVDQNGKLMHTNPEIPADETNLKNKRFGKSLFYHFLQNRTEILLSQQLWLLDTINRLGYELKLPRVPGIISGWYVQGWKKRFEVTKKLLKYFNEHVKNNNQKTNFALLFLPSPFQTEKIFQQIIRNNVKNNPYYGMFLGDIDRPQNLVKKFCIENEIPFIDATPALRVPKDYYSNFFLREGHLNEYGSKIVAKVLHQYISNQKEK